MVVSGESELFDFIFDCFVVFLCHFVSAAFDDILDFRFLMECLQITPCLQFDQQVCCHEVVY